MGAGLEAGGGALLAEVTTDQEINSGITEQEEPIEIPRGPDDNSKLYRAANNSVNSDLII